MTCPDSPQRKPTEPGDPRGNPSSRETLRPMTSSRGARRRGEFLPPRLPRLLLRLLLRGSDYDEFTDDMNEVHHRLSASKSRLRADLWYWLRTLESLPSILMEKLSWRAAMLKNGFRIAVRRIVRQKGYAAINIVGLAVGMACCVLIWLYVSHEMSYDRFHPQADRTLRVSMQVQMADLEIKAETASEPMAATLRRDYPEVEQACWHRSYRGILVEVDGESFSDDLLLFVDENFFDFFSVEFLSGSPGMIIDRPGTLLMTDEAAAQYFGPADPIGRRITIEEREYEVTGLIEPPPSNTHLPYRFITSRVNYRKKPAEMTEWANLDGQTFIRLKPGVDAGDFQEKIRWVAHLHRGDYFKQRGWTYESILEPLPRLHLHSIADAGNSPLMIYAVSVIGILILLIACLNFVNLTTARAATRAREMGVRKVAGARRGQLIQQFIGESMSLTAAAFLLSGVIMPAALPVFNRLIERPFDPAALIRPSLLTFMGLLVIGIGTLAGSYPAFFISRQEPVAALANRSAGGTRRSLLRRALVIIQFTITTVLIVCTLTVFRQIHFMKHKTLGFDKQQKLIIPARFDDNLQAVKSRFLSHPRITGAAACSVPIGRTSNSRTTRLYDGETQEAVLDYICVDPDLIPEYDIQMAAGRPFSWKMGTDVEKTIILNRTAAKVFGWGSPEEAIGRTLETNGRGPEYFRTIIGVTEDFHYKGLQKEIGALGLMYWPRRFRYLSLTVEAEDLKRTLAFIEKTWRGLHLGPIFSYRFLDEHFNRQYAAEERVGRIFTTFALLAVLLSCLGLVGLSSFVTTRRTKEIGIRKVLGASVARILRLISREFVLLLAAANLIAWPLAWLAMRAWLGNFAFRIDLSWTIFALSTIVGLGAALASVAWQSLRAARADPVDSLRCE